MDPAKPSEAVRIAATTDGWGGETSVRTSRSTLAPDWATSDHKPFPTIPMSTSRIAVSVKAIITFSPFGSSGAIAGGVRIPTVSQSHQFGRPQRWIRWGRPDDRFRLLAPLRDLRQAAGDVSPSVPATSRTSKLPPSPSGKFADHSARPTKTEAPAVGLRLLRDLRSRGTARDEVSGPPSAKFRPFRRNLQM